MKQRKSLEKRLKENRYNELYISNKLAIEFSVQVNSIMQKRNISRKDLSEAMGCSRAYITQVLDGYTNLTFKTLGKIASALQMDIKSPELYYRDLVEFKHHFDTKEGLMTDSNIEQSFLKVS